MVKNGGKETVWKHHCEQCKEVASSRCMNQDHIVECSNPECKHRFSRRKNKDGCPLCLKKKKTEAAKKAKEAEAAQKKKEKEDAKKSEPFVKERKGKPKWEWGFGGDKKDNDNGGNGVGGGNGNAVAV